MATTKKLMGTTAVGGADLLAIEDVFSTYLYEGNASGQGATAQSITNNIDLSGEGGLVWIKNRDSGGTSAWSHYLFDTERGATKYVRTNVTNGETTSNNSLSAFNSDGFTLGEAGGTNNNGDSYASWTFRKAPRFFDVVTYTGDDTTNRKINHNLGIIPGCIIVKAINYDGGNPWSVYHRSLGATKGLRLNTTDAAGTDIGYWYNQSPTDTQFGVGPDAQTNGTGINYVAYLFAHDPLGPSGDGSDGLIACGSLTLTSGNVTSVDLGWEPQWLLVKKSSAGQNWQLFDNMRGFLYGFDGTNSRVLTPNTSAVESNLQASPLSDGFALDANNWGAGDYIYIAIRRGPMRQPTSGTEVFAMDTYDTTTGDPTAYDTTFPIDAAWQALNKNATTTHRWSARITGGEYLVTSSTAAGTTVSAYEFDNQTGFRTDPGTDVNDFAWMLRRAPGFFDVVAYTGDGTAGRTVSHNLGVAPEMIIVKNRSSAYDWPTWAASVSYGTNLYLNLSNSVSVNDPDVLNYNETTNTPVPPTSTDFTVGTHSRVNGSGQNYIAYLFATLPGVSKVGSYTGNGGTGDINVDCGFTSGARFVLIKDATSANDWYVWDTARGIVAGNDPYLRLNSTGAETTDSDWVDPYSAGFTVTTGLYANLRINVLGNTYIYLAIA